MFVSYMSLNERLFWRLSLLAILTLVMFMSVTWWVDPARAYQLRQEGALFQIITVVMFLLASGVAVFFIHMRKPGLIYIIIPVLGILYAGEELSWIGRIVEPPIIKGVSIDSLHDFIQAAFAWLQIPDWTIIALVGVFLVVVVMLILACCALGLLENHKPLALVGISFLFIVAGQVVDNIDQKTHFQKYFFEELPENLGALLMLIAAIAIAYHCHNSPESHQTVS